MPEQTRPCEYCGIPITRTGKQNSQRSSWTCGRSCAGFLRVQRGHVAGKWQANRFRGQRDIRPCSECGSLITRYVTEQNHDQPWRCSRKCMLIELQSLPREKHGSEIVCQSCSKPFYVQPSLLKRGQKYCSAECAHLGLVKGWTHKPCEHCHGDMLVRDSQVDVRRFCSMACTTLGKVKRPTGRMHNGKPARLIGDGYVKVWEPNHPHNIQGWVLEHRLVMEKVLGRYLDPSEEVDHKNDIKNDNDPSNLQVLSKPDHRRKTGATSREKRAKLVERISTQEAELAVLRAKLAALETTP